MEYSIDLGSNALKIFPDDSGDFAPNGIGRVRVVGVLVGEV
jgi:hypothetical protein